MKRLAPLAILASALLAAACIDPTPAPASATQNRNGNGPSGSTDGGTTPPPDAGSQTQAGPLDAGLVVASHGNTLPAPWAPSSMASLATNGTGPDALAYNNQLVVVSGPLTVANPRSPPCYAQSGTFCDGFQVSDLTNASTVVNYYEFLGSRPACASQFADKSTLNGPLLGVWQNDFVTEKMDNTYAIALASCDGLAGNPPPGGGSTAAPATTQIHALLAAYPADGGVVSVSGLVIASYSITSGANAGAFGFTMVDPQPPTPMAPSGIKVFHSAASKVTANAPSVGDYVTITGNATGGSPGFEQLTF